MRADQTQKGVLFQPLVLIAYILALVALVAVMTSIGNVTGPDDIMRWVQVRDLLAGQGWYDLVQHRLGPGDGTLMHWSRLVDAPIAAIYWISDLILPPELALKVTAFVWPTLLAACTLFGFAAIGSQLGGRAGAVSAIYAGALTIEYSRKFDYFSFDHHNLQILLYVSAIAFIALRNQHRMAAFFAGCAVSLSLSIGTESLLQIGLVAMFFAVEWLIDARGRKEQTISFGSGMIVAMGPAILFTSSNQSFFFPGCDALTFSVALPVMACAGGLTLLAILIPNSTWLVRVIAATALAIVVVILSKTFAPYCLGNPIDQMSPVIRQFWLSQVSEAHGISTALEQYPGSTISLLVISAVSIIGNLFFLWYSDRKAEYALFLVLMVSSLALFLFQIRMLTFLTMVLVPVQAQILAVMYVKYKQEKNALYGLFVILFIPFISPKVGEILEERYLKFTTNAEEQVENQVSDKEEDSINCDASEAYVGIKQFEPGLVMLNTNHASDLLRFTEHSALAGNYHRGEAGLIAQIDLFRTEPEDALPKLNALGIDMIMLCKHAARADYWASVSDGDGLPKGLIDGPLPDYLEAVEDEAFYIFRVVPQS